MVKEPLNVTETREFVRQFTRGYAALAFVGDRPPHSFDGDGCTCSPDFAFNGADLRPACRWHDWAYRCGGSEVSRRAADRAFRVNLKFAGCPWWQARFYFHAVRWWGVLAWDYGGGAPPTVRATFCRWWRVLREGPA